MAYKTFAELIVMVEKELSLVAGTAVQTYAEDEIAHHLQQNFNSLFDRRWWNEFSSWQTYTLDGTTGIPSSDVTDTLVRYKDIGVMYRGGTRRKMLRTPTSTNPTLLTGSTPLYHEPYPEETPARIFRVRPVTAEGTVDVYVRTKPDDFDDDDTVKMDPDLLVLMTAETMCASDGGGSLQLQSLSQRREEAEQRVLAGEQGDSPVPINPEEYPNGLEEWA